MSDIEHHFTSGIYCNKCDARRESPELMPRWSREAKQFLVDAQAAGWTRWVGRSSRDYCPACVPSPGHTMRPIVAVLR